MSDVLLIDADPLERESLRDVLERAGHRVLEAGDGKAGIAVFGSFAVDVVVCDLQVPRLDGREVLRQVHSLRPQVRLVALSDSGRDLRAPASPRILAKPFAAHDLLEAVAGALPGTPEDRSA
jgi:CheY-like chemotaxis protein